MSRSTNSVASKTKRLAGPRRRGFLLMVVVGVLAVLLAVCVGFLSFTRAEVTAVQTVRDKNDVNDVMFSAADWTIANIGNYVFSGGSSFDASKYVAFTQGGGGPWWYRPYEKDLKDKFADWDWGLYNYAYRWNNLHADSQPRPRCVSASGIDQAEWVYLPEGFFPEGGVRGRFMVQVLDPNSVINMNDWLTDGCPTQTQMAHIIRDAYGEQQLERYRRHRDGAPGGYDRQPKFAPLRFQEAWRVATRSLRQPQYASSYSYEGERPYREISPNWVTTNSTYFSQYAGENILRSCVSSDGIFTNIGGSQSFNINVTGFGQYMPPTQYEGRPSLGWTDGGSGYSMPYKGDSDPVKRAYGWNSRSKWSAGQLPNGMPFSIYGYEDPDTGRCPLNVNTCFNSGERLPTGVFGGTPTYAIEGVFNVDSLRKIIWVGTFWSDDSAEWVDLRPGSSTSKKTWADLSANDKVKVEYLKTRLAYQYQESLCRYFTGTYRHSMQREHTPFINHLGDPRPARGALNYKDGEYSANVTFNSAYGFTPTGAATFTDYSGVRFPTSLSDFQSTMLGAIGTMASYVISPRSSPGVEWVFDDYDASLVNAGDNGDVYVHFDRGGDPEVPPGRLDPWTANAIYDNIVPGKPSSWPTSAGDPLLRLWQMRLAREEFTEDSDFESHFSKSLFGYHEDNPSLFDSGNHGPTQGSWNWTTTNIGSKATSQTRLGLNLRPKGADIRADNGIIGPPGPWDDKKKLNNTPIYLEGNQGRSGTPPWASGVGQIPYRQWTFGPDWFSTELTTSTTNFILIINAQIVDAKSVTENPNNPVVVFHSQAGFAVELCPDIRKEGDSLGTNWPSGDSWSLDSTNIEWAECGLGYYRGRNPENIKTRGARNVGQTLDSTKVHSMDYKCGTLLTQYNRGSNTPYQNTSTVKEWKADFRGVRPANASSFYNNRTTTRRVLIRGYWTMDTIISR